MCGIIGYVGKDEAVPILIKGLTRLEYRGYDSAGVRIPVGTPELRIKGRRGMKNRKTSPAFSLIFLCATIIFSGPLFAADLMIASFGTGGNSDVCGGVGTWDSNPLDKTQGCKMDVILMPGVMGNPTQTNVLKISYDVESTEPAFNGIWIGFNNTDLSSYDEMSMLIKGDEEAGFTTQFKLELKNAKGERVVCIVKGITDQWQRVVIPMKELKAPGSISDWSKMKELVFTFDDLTVTRKNGILYVDDIKFSSKERAQ